MTKKKGTSTNSRRKRLEMQKRIIRSAMGRAGICSQRELADRIGIGEAVISGRFTGRTEWDIGLIRELDKILQFQDEELLKLIRG